MAITLKPLQVIAILGASSGIGLALRDFDNECRRVGKKAPCAAGNVGREEDLQPAAVDGCTDPLRLELEHDRLPVSASRVNPGRIDVRYLLKRRCIVEGFTRRSIPQAGMRNLPQRYRNLRGRVQATNHSLLTTAAVAAWGALIATPVGES
jgi:NAD(P)-dependent dehydrogenase (short-subunit alcohol dehydrogenase family)